MFDPRDFDSDPRPAPQARPKKDRRTDEQITTDAWRKSEEIRDYYKSSQFHSDQRARFVERREAPETTRKSARAWTAMDTDANTIPAGRNAKPSSTARIKR